MCGIIGYTGSESSLPYLIDGLHRLEYRGYDSAGVAVIGDSGEILVAKKGGRISSLEEHLNGKKLCGTVGIGHTRWATHGEPSDRNSHPHVGERGKIALVHNGIIENYLEIKDYLLERGVSFRSDTDTEVIAQLIEYNYAEDGDLISAIRGATEVMRGAWALGILCSENPDEIIAVRKDTPLLVGYGSSCNFIASDVTALLAHTREVTYMDDGEIARVRRDSVEFFDGSGRRIYKERHTVDWDITSAERGGYRHFMQKEIMEQPEAIRKTLIPRIKNGRIAFDELAGYDEILRSAKKIYVVACGSAYHVGAHAKYTLERLTKIPVEACLASEFRYSNPLVDENTLVIVISQSGETLDSMAALREAKRRGGRTLAIVNVIGSSIAREADCVLYTWAGPEIAVATTKAYSTQMALITMLGVYVANLLGRISSEEYEAYISGLASLPDEMTRVLRDQEQIKSLAKKYSALRSVFYIGRNVDYALGLEGSLKLKEISYVHSESYAAGELKHGTISLIEDGVLVVALATHEPLFEKTLSNVAEVKSRGADVIVLTTEGLEKDVGEKADTVITVPRVHPLLESNLAILPLQLFAYYVALERGCDIDKPRNLAKSVTVE